jgi:hypothetical protein
MNSGAAKSAGAYDCLRPAMPSKPSTFGISTATLSSVAPSIWIAFLRLILVAEKPRILSALLVKQPEII